MIRRSRCFCFWFTQVLHKIILEADAHFVDFIDDITIYKGSGNINRNTKTLSKVLQICHEWAQECHTEFDYGDKLVFLHLHRSKHGQPEKKKIKMRSKATCAPKCWLR